MTSSQSQSQSQCFDCNICFEIAKEPVITLCGHLYCWPCIYKWCCYQNPSHQIPRQCPVCKAEISQTTVVPLYGRGETTASQYVSELEGEDEDILIPPRPRGLGTILTSSTTQTQLQYQNLYYPPQLDFSILASRYEYEEEFSDESVDHSIGFGEMVYRRYFGNLQNLYNNPNSYGLVPNSNIRLRRQHMLADKYLGRISLFFFCCLLFCLCIF